MEIWILIICSIVCLIMLLLSAFFSASETAYSSITKPKLETNLKDGVAKKIIMKRYSMFSVTLSTILIGNNIVNIISSLLLSLVISSLVTNKALEIIVSTAVMTPIIVIFGEILPKMVARRKAITFLKSTYWIMQIFYTIFWPLTWILSKLFKESDITNTETELKQILKNGYDEGVLEKEESILAMNALDFDSIKLNKHYVKSKDITYVDYGMGLEEIKAIFQKSNYSRLPVRKKEKFIGIILLKDIFNLHEFNIDEYIIEVPSVSVNSLLKIAFGKMKDAKSQFAFVTKTNEDKEIIGMITFEDILEELVGEIYDEHDYRDELSIYEIEEDMKIVVSSSAKVSEVNEALELEIVSEFKTIGEWLENISGKKLNMKFKFSYDNKNVLFKVIENKRNKEPKIEITKK